MIEMPLDIKFEHCKACGVCYTLCPKKAISADEKGRVSLSNPDKCSKCGICQSHCPDYVLFVRRKKNGSK